MAEWNGAELGDEVGVAISVRIEQVTSLAAHECLVEAETLVEESFVRRDVPYIGILLLRAPIPQRRERDSHRRERICGLRWTSSGACVLGRRGAARELCCACADAPPATHASARS